MRLGQAAIAIARSTEGGWKEGGKQNQGGWTRGYCRRYCRRSESPSNAWTTAVVGTAMLLLATASTTMPASVDAFAINAATGTQNNGPCFARGRRVGQASLTSHVMSPSCSSTALPMVWWFGGSESEEDNDESCELVAVRIERTSPNSRRIGGEILVPRPPEDVWAILTDYDRLSTHVPNLVESRQVTRGKVGEPGDGSYKCRLYQRGSQKIIGFEFGASVTMQMTERMTEATRMIDFQCVDSPFFSEFDGQWHVSATSGGEDDEEVMTTVKYVVDVRPKGPVPVAALEWRIREDVPTNLRAVKKAAMEVGEEGVLRAKRRRLLVLQPGTTNEAALTLVGAGSATAPSPKSIGTVENGRLSLNTSQASRSSRTTKKEPVTASAVAATVNSTRRSMKRRLKGIMVRWDDNETMATYLNRKK